MILSHRPYTTDDFRVIDSTSLLMIWVIPTPTSPLFIWVIKHFKHQILMSLKPYPLHNTTGHFRVTYPLASLLMHSRLRHSTLLMIRVSHTSKHHYWWMILKAIKQFPAITTDDSELPALLLSLLMIRAARHLHHYWWFESLDSLSILMRVYRPYITSLMILKCRTPLHHYWWSLSYNFCHYWWLSLLHF
jgi:hypothetical protein